MSVSWVLLEQERVLVPGDGSVRVGKYVAGKDRSVVLVWEDDGLMNENFGFVWKTVEVKNLNMMTTSDCNQSIDNAN